MIYFIPSWYQKDNWCENEQTWYVRRMHTEYDDTIKQIQLFHRSGAYPYQVTLLGYAPNFRHFLHRQGIFRADYWSCFDAIQCVRRKKSAIFSFHDMNWPEDIEFVYTPFVVTAWLNGKRYAQVEFGEDGNPIRIDVYKNDKVYRRIIYDDRGFISSFVGYEGEKPAYQEYLSESGVWKMRCYLNDGHVEINPDNPDYLLIGNGGERNRKFSRLTYDSLEQVIEEVLISYLGQTDSASVFCVAVHERHLALLKTALIGRKLILSFFEDRYCFKNISEISDMLENADFIIADSKVNVRNIQRQFEIPLENIMSITPYDTRRSINISQQLEMQKLLIPVDGLAEETLKELIRVLGEYGELNEKIQINLFTRNADAGRKKKLLDQARKYLKDAGLEKQAVKFSAEQCVDELAVSNCMCEQRLIIDMRSVPELYLQIMAISIGIPQIVHVETEFVEHGRNGMVLKELDKLHEVMGYYLKSLSNWNEAMVYSFEIGKRYTAGMLMESWREVIEFVEQDSCIAIGK